MQIIDHFIWCYREYTVYPKKYAHGFVVLWFVVVMQSLIMNSYEVFIHIHQGCFAGTGAIVIADGEPFDNKVYKLLRHIEYDLNIHYI